MPPEVATKAVEWYELQGDAIWTTREGSGTHRAAIRRARRRSTELQRQALWEALRLETRASAFRERSQAMLKDNAIQQDLKRERIEQTRQRVAWQDFLESHGGLASSERKSLAELEPLKKSKHGSTLSEKWLRPER